MHTARIVSQGLPVAPHFILYTMALFHSNFEQLSIASIIVYMIAYKETADHFLNAPVVVANGKLCARLSERVAALHRPGHLDRTPSTHHSSNAHTEKL